MAGSTRRRWCARPGCRHAPSRHWTDDTSCSCGCPQWEDFWPHVWRELCVTTWFHADQVWMNEREAASNGWQAERLEFARDNPRPTFKKILQGLAYSPDRG